MLKLLTRQVSGRAVSLIVFDAALIVAAVAGGTWIRVGAFGWDLVLAQRVIPKALIFAFVIQVCFYYGELYDLRILSDRREISVRLMQALGAASFTLAGIFFWFPSLVIGRGVFVTAVFLVIWSVVGWRFIFERVTRSLGPRERLLLVGTNAAAIALARELHEHRVRLGVEIVGFIDPDPSRVGLPLVNPGIVGTIEDIPSVVRLRGVDRVVVSLADGRGTLPMHKLLDMKLAGVRFDHLASVYESYTGKIAVENLRPSWLIFSEGFRCSRRTAALKRVIDVALAAVGLVLGAPLMLAVALAVRCSSRGPILYRQARVGRGGQTFTIYKFRSMRVDAEASTGPVWAQTRDPRVTPVGGHLRRMRLDELPQLLNVLFGNMSFVGPRPERPEFVSTLSNQIPFYRQRHVVRPGVTGWAQVRYAYGASAEDALQKLQYDLYYIKNMTLSLDLFIILLTIKTVIQHRGT
jgi:sugar transferase (PEP-CTERM system associated)